MITRIITAALLLSAVGMASAQNDDGAYRMSLQIGPKGGVTYSNVYDADGEAFNADAKFGFTIGGFASIPVNMYWGVQPEVMITQKGFKGNGRLLGSDYSFTRTTTFLDIPILLAIKPNEVLTILAGPQYSYLLYQSDTFTSSSTSFTQEQEFRQDNIRDNIFGVVVGADVNMQQTVIGARIGWDIMDNKGDGTSTTPRYKNLSAQITVGFRL